ncbi:UNVERIFIED_CONTAM: hypothetical protein RMT77_004553 [Armadillidium vulgare]
MGVLKFKFESEVEFKTFNRKSTTEENEGRHEHDLTVTTSRDHSLCSEKRIIKKLYLECEKDFQLYSSQDKYNFEGLNKEPVVNQDDHEYDMHVVKRRDHPLCNEKIVVGKPWLDCEKDSYIKSLHTDSYSSRDIGRDSRAFPFQNENDNGNFQKFPTENQGVNILNQQGMKNNKFDIHVSPKFDEDYIDVFTKEIVKVQVDEGELFNSQSEEENKQMINKSYTVTPPKEINIFKISRVPEPKEENSIESSNIVVVSESVYENEDMKVEPSNYLSFSSSSSSSSSFSSSFSNSVEENEIKGKKKMKMIHRKRKRKGDNDNNDDGRNIFNYKSDTRTASKRFIIQTKQLTLYK